MTDINRLPRNWAKAMKNAAAASEAVRNILMSGDPAYEIVYTHFLGDALPSNWGAAKTNGTSAAVTVASSRLTCTSGTDDDGYAGQGFGLFWSGDKGFYFENYTALDTVTTSKLEVGVTDSIADAGAVGAKATPTATASDFCVLVRDTDDNTDLDLISLKSGGSATANAEGVYTVAGGTYFRSEFRGQNDAVSVFVNGGQVGSGAIEGGNAISPWVFVQSRAVSASRIATSEYWIMVGPSGLAIPG
jgi:hypothetical protein